MVGFVAAGLTNILGILLFSQGLTNRTLFESYPEVFGFMGCVSVILWGLAYLSVASSPSVMICQVFFVEKMVYVATWLYWLKVHGEMLPGLWQSHPLTAFFLSFYGPLDLAFGAWFLQASRR